MEYLSLFISWFLQNFTSEDISMIQLIGVLGVASLISVYIFCVYKVLTRKTVYSLRYNFMIAAMVLIIAAIIFSVQSSVGLSLGVMGALSIVRFRTAIKEPLDIVFLFWAITAGICIGADMSEIAITFSGLLTVLIFFLEDAGGKRAKKLLIVELKSEEDIERIFKMVKSQCKSYEVKNRTNEEQGYKIVLEVKCKEEYQFFEMLSGFEGIKGVSLISQLGENCF